MTATQHIMQPLVTDDDVDVAFDRAVKFGDLAIELVAKCRLALAKAKSLVTRRYEQATDALKAHAQAGPFEAAGHQWSLKAPTFQDSLPFDATFAALEEAGCTVDQILDAVQFQPARVRILCEAFGVDYMALVERTYNRPALNCKRA
jgi:hypothetical protein